MIFLRQNNKNRYTFILLLSGLLFAFLMFTLLNLDQNIFDNNFISVDAHTYIEASNLLYNEVTPHPLRPLGYAFLLGLPNMMMDGVSTNAYIIYSIILNILLWMGTIYFLYLTLQLFCGKKTSLLASFVFVICIGNMIQIFRVSTEITTTFLLMLMTYFIFKFDKNKKIRFLLWGVSVLNLMILFKPGMLYYAALTTLFVMVYLNYIKEIKSLINIPFLISILFVLIQVTTIYKTYGNITPSYIDKLAWYTYLGGKSSAKTSNSSYFNERETRKNNLKGKNWSEKSLISKNDMRSQLTNNPEIVFREYLKNIFENSTTGSSRIRTIQKLHNENYKISLISILHKISKYQNITIVLFSFLSLILLIIKRSKIPIVVLISFGSVFYTIATSGISFYQGDRFHVVIYAVSIVMILYSLSAILHLKKYFRR